MTRINKNFMLSKRNLDYINEVKESRDLKYISDALEIIINEHRESADSSVEYIIKVLTEKISDSLIKELSGIKKIANHTDKLGLVMIEMLNGMFFKENYKDIPTTTEAQCQALKIATKEVEKRISEIQDKNEL